MKRPKGFSLIEMLMVISIILILLVVFQNLFKPKNMHLYNGQKCVNDLYSFVNQFTMASLSSKGFNSGGTMIYPIGYKIDVSTTNNKITNSINTGAGYFQRRISDLSGTDASNICYINNAYRVILTGNNIEIEINKTSLNSQFNLSGTSNNSTGQIDLLLCQSNNTGCMHIGQYIIDKRIQTITKKVCLSFSGNDCISWNQ